MHKLNSKILVAAFWMAMIPIISAAPAASNVQAPPGAVLAWLRFSNGTQSYAGLPYLFLGDGNIQLKIDVPPRPGLALDLLWGSKNDTRSAEIAINGKAIKLQSGGYDGYRWLRMPIPEGITGNTHEVLLRTDRPGSPAFLAEVRLATVEKSDAHHHPDLKATASKISLKTLPASSEKGEAFPDMRKVWDRKPPVTTSPLADQRLEKLYGKAEENARFAAEAFYRCRRFVDGWLAQADPKSGLIPRNLGRDRDLWNGRDSAADNYPFMVLTCALTDRPMFSGRMLDMLRTEIRLTSRIDRLCDHYLFSKQGFATEKPNLDQIIFDNAEYVKDGLIPLSEWLGPSPWSERMIGMMEDIWKHAPIDTPFGKIPTLNFEVNGDLLQACSRLYWFTGQKKFLDWAIRLGDYYLLGDHHPTRHSTQLRLNDHGCEVINGLSELYVAVHYAAPEKKRAYESAMHAIFDRILEVGRNEHGLLYSSFNPQTGEHSKGICDTWGYSYDGFYTMYLIDKTEAYREAALKALRHLRDHYPGAPWDDKSADGYADSIEGAINLYNREPVASAAEWIDSQTRRMWAIQKSDGIIEGWHGDGNIARTSIMFALWKTQGARLEPWRADVRMGAVRDGDTLLISLSADEAWSGKLLFDRARHKLSMHLPLDYPRINQFPEWFTVESKQSYNIKDLTADAPTRHSGQQLADGIAVSVKSGSEVRLQVSSK